MSTSTTDQFEDEQLDDDSSIETLNLTDGIDTDAPGADEDRGDVVRPAAKGPAEQEDASPQPSNRMIPLGRFNEVNERAKQLAAQNQQLLDALTRSNAAPSQPAEAAPPAVDPSLTLKEKRAEYHQMLMNGDEEGALRVQEEVDQLVEDRATARALEQFRQEKAQETRNAELSSFQQTVAEIQAAYPQLDSSSAQADPDAIMFVVAKRDALMQQGHSPADSLRQASDAAARVFGLESGVQPSPTKRTNSDNRHIEAATRNARAANQQPAPLGGVGNRASAPARVDVASMTDDQFDALPESEKARLRGD